jgi:hypothetical protein
MFQQLFFVRSVVASVLCLAFLASCATMSPEECKVANWRDVGQRDGLQGEALSQLNDRAEDCAKGGVTINTQAYMQGRDEGLRSYCRVENAVPLGLSGGTYRGVCPGYIDAQFQMRFQIARAVHDLRSEVKNLDSRTDTLERRLRDANRSEESRLRDAASEEERKKVRKSLDDERREIREQLSETDRRLRHKRDELRAAEYDLSNVR